MLRLLGCAILALFFLGCSWRVNNVDVCIGGKLNALRAERDAASFEEQWNKQFESNIKMPRLPFNVGRYVDSLVDRDGVKIISVEGKF